MSVAILDKKSINPGAGVWTFTITGNPSVTPGLDGALTSVAIQTDSSPANAIWQKIGPLTTDWELLSTGPLAPTASSTGTAPVNINSTATWNPSAGSSSTAFPLVTTALLDGSTDITGGAEGGLLQAASLSTRTGAVGYLKGVRGVAQRTAAAGITALVVACEAWADSRTGLTTLQAALSALVTVQANGTTTKAAGVLVNRPTVSSGSTATELSAIRIEDASGQAGTVTALYAIRSVGDVPSVFDGSVSASKFIAPVGNAPASASAAGVTGQIAWDSGFLYICVAANTWKRVAVDTW